MASITLLGTGSPLPSATRAGPATLVTAGDDHYLVDAGRGVLMRLAAVGLGASNISALLVTHLHSDHITDLGDVITTRWVTTFEPTPLLVVGPVGTREVVNHLLESLEADISYRITHHGDLKYAPPVDVIEASEGDLGLPGVADIGCAATDHRPVEPSIGFRIDHDGSSVVLAGDTVPCEGLDRLCSGADALVHSAIRKDIISSLPIQRLVDTLDYHSSPEEAAATAQRAGVGTLVLTHYVPEIAPGGEQAWIDLASQNFDGRIEVGDDLLRVEVGPAGR